MRFFLVILLTINYIETAKILIYNPAFGHSHTKFLGRIGDVLSQNGHQVTELVPLQNPLDYKKVSKLTKIIELPQDARIKEMMLDSNRDGGMMSQMWTMDPTPQALSQMAQNMSLMMTYTCESILEHKNLWWHLKDEQFDIGISEAFDFAGYGVFHMLGVKSYITASSSIMLDHLAYLIGQPIVPSYVPGAMGDVTEQMTFTQRAMNAFGAYVGSQMFLNIMHKQSAVFQEKLGSDFPSIASLVSDKSASVLINSIPYLNFPHPKLHKVQEIGGIGIPTVKPVSKEWDEILNRKSKTIYISFGSVAKSKLMPVALKKSLIETTRRFPDVQFIWKYEADDLTDLPDNLYLSKWTPQSDLLADPRLTLFVTHGGLGSTTEIAYSGIPAICIPVFADQPRNAMTLKRQGVAESLTKYEFADPNKLSALIEKFLKDDSYKKNAKKLAELLHNVPFKPEEILVKNVDFVARVGHLKQLDPYGRKLSFVQYFLLDVIAAIIAVVLVIIFVIVFTIKKLLGLCCKTSKSKKD